MTIRVWLLGLLTGILLSAVCEAVTIRGSRSCGTWIEDRQKHGPSSIAIESWLVGYLSGLSQAFDKEFWQARGKNSLSNASLFLWLDNYCRANPLKPIEDGADTLFIEWTSRPSR